MQELVLARKLVIKIIGTNDNPTDVETKYIENGKKLTHLLGAVRMKMGVGLSSWSVATVVLQGCATIVHVEGTMTGLIAAVPGSLSLDGQHSGNGVSWHVPGGLVASEPSVFFRKN